MKRAPFGAPFLFRMPREPATCGLMLLCPSTNLRSIAVPRLHLDIAVRLVLDAVRGHEARRAIVILDHVDVGAADSERRRGDAAPVDVRHPLRKPLPGALGGAFDGEAWTRFSVGWRESNPPALVHRRTEGTCPWSSIGSRRTHVIGHEGSPDWSRGLMRPVTDGQCLRRGRAGRLAAPVVSRRRCARRRV